jgi:hypothetical protein
MPKNKEPTRSERLRTIAQQAGLCLMSAAITLGMTETPDHNNRIIIPNQPSFAMANEQNEFNNNSNDNNSILRRENQEESELKYISYSVTQRTPARSSRA